MAPKLQRKISSPQPLASILKKTRGAPYTSRSLSSLMITSANPFFMGDKEDNATRM